ncbi:MAG TPA: DinB family protein [bacterium]|nr:DinB family protein [bacterium]
MQSIDLIRQNLEQSRDRVLVRVEEMREHCFVFPTPHGGGHTLWVLGHLAYIEGDVTRRFMQGLENPLAHWESVFDGADTSGDPGDFPPFDEVLAACRDARRATLDLLGSMSESDLDETSVKAPEGFEYLFGTRRHCFQFVADHWYMHRGQLADARRAARIERMWF